MMVTQNGPVVLHATICSLAAGVSSRKKSSVEDNLDIGKNGLNLYPFLDLKRLIMIRIRHKAAP